MRAYSEGAIIPARSECGYQLSLSGRKRRRAAHHALSEICEVLSYIRLEGEQVPDLRDSGTLSFHPLDHFSDRAFGGLFFNVFQIHRLHRLILFFSFSAGLEDK
jgi:hypothetical protein